MKKTFVLVVLFILPLVAYLFFASGVNNFGRLPVLSEEVGDLGDLHPELSFKDHITILGFLGNDLELKQANAFNLNQKIYKPFYEFNDFQMVMVVPQGQEQAMQEILDELGSLVDISRWKIAYGSPEQIKKLHDSLGTGEALDADLGTDLVYIIDKDARLRGRTDDEDEGTKYGFDATSVAELNNKMEDDVKVILAEYRLALKKNNADRQK